MKVSYLCPTDGRFIANLQIHGAPPDAARCPTCGRDVPRKPRKKTRRDISVSARTFRRIRAAAEAAHMSTTEFVEHLLQNVGVS
jgi:hypothetical protein